ncbi:4-amino-6-deoxy-N-Acetyl-D-hexosaminyl-(Lipid carrier) acetyltrasferase [hydrothermal vent metagenome]|uniref:4-amino-6-deoxy-N-Acetyl-D-hexosaminyl-(Lipid carrier) acetyltrasferase n=1 Tax=hydrothermal vent metagenome TaxID=652676 RepID=A0A1W1C1D2_9ZZZZ
MKKPEILLIGGGGHCRSVIDVIELEGKYAIAGIIDKKELIGQEVLGYKIIGCDDDLVNLFKKYKYAIVTVGQIKSNSLRVELFNRLKEIGYMLPVIISPLAYISKYSSIGEGTIIMHQALVNANAAIGKNCIINTKALIEHDAVVEDSCHISTGTIINGGVVVKENTFIGSNSTTKEHIEVDGFTKAGSVVK